MNNPVKAADVEKAFIEDFKALLKKHDVEFEISENVIGYGDIKASAEIFGYTRWDDNDNVIRECVDFELPRFMG